MGWWPNARDHEEVEARIGLDDAFWLRIKSARLGFGLIEVTFKLQVF